jgi:V-type H+-transporting ATPase subunit C
METQLWAIGIHGSSPVSALKAATSDLATCTPFTVPASELRVGTLDSLMSLSDDLAKMDILAEATVAKIYKQLLDLDASAVPSIKGVPPASYVTMQWQRGAWDEAKFQLRAPLRELSEYISMRISALDEELKVKVSEVNGLKGSVQGYERKMQGNLMVRGLADLIGEKDVMESDYMTTLYVVVPKANMKEYETSYERMATYVVPKSAVLIKEDTEYGLYTTVIFKKSLDEFKASAREKRLTLRDFTYDPNALAAENTKKDADMVEYEKLKGSLKTWCEINYAETYEMMVHLKAVRIFVESVLRYGLTASNMGAGMVPNFKSVVLQPKKGMAEKLRKTLGAMYGGDGAMAGGDGEEEMVVPGATGEFYPYVYTSIETEPNLS